MFENSLEYLKVPYCILVSELKIFLTYFSFLQI